MMKHEAQDFAESAAGDQGEEATLPIKEEAEEAKISTEEEELADLHFVQVFTGVYILVRKPLPPPLWSPPPPSRRYGTVPIYS